MKNLKNILVISGLLLVCCVVNGMDLQEAFKVVDKGMAEVKESSASFDKKAHELQEICLRQVKEAIEKGDIVSGLKIIAKKIGDLNSDTINKLWEIFVDEKAKFVFELMLRAHGETQVAVNEMILAGKVKTAADVIELLALVDGLEVKLLEMIEELDLIS